MTTPQSPWREDGLCCCGCGETAPISKRTDKKTGLVAGKPTRFINGHQHRKAPAEYIVDDETECWVWQLSTSTTGYGVKRHNGVLHKAHRVYYEQAKGAIPEGLVIDHLCKNPLCVNPDHLEPVTQAENVHRSSLIKLTPEAQDLARNLEGSVSYREIARRIGVHHKTVCQFLAGKTWQGAA